ncbi:hypothetical protein V5E97_18320 [Singulisphaera sp. Ch08]|uniref:AMIN domain-containing protein n=1 Tax=Singulisphaera sp. Ch08 TaxID=3120278 RepID=A0AAU7CSH4_9BACT
MNRLFVPIIENTGRNRLLDATRMSIIIAWRLLIAAFALAIIVGMSAKPAHLAESSPMIASQPIRVVKNGNSYHIFTQLPTGKDSLEIELMDFFNNKQIHALYSNKGLLNSFTHVSDKFLVSYTTRPGGGEIVNIRTPVSLYSVELHSNGESKVNVTASTTSQLPLGEIRVSPEGKRLPDSKNIDSRR